MQIKNYYTKTKYLSEKYLNKIKAISIRTNFLEKVKIKLREKSFTDFLFYSLKNNKKIYLTDEILFSPISIKSLIKIIKVICKRN